jgi:VWFA-related protein
MRRSVLLLIGLVGLSQLQSNGVTVAQAPQATFSTKATAVVVDVVVRDRKGAPVLDLKPDEFELFEDDARQTIGAVELVTPDRLSRGPRTPSPSDASPGVDAPPAAGGSIAGPTLVALAFHRLTPEARALAHQAAQTYLELGVRPSDFAGVFLIDTGLETLQTYTNERTKLRAAIDAVAARATSVYARQSMGPAGSAGGDGNPAVSPTAGADSPGRPTGNPGTTFENPGAPRGVNEMLQKMAEKMEESYGALMRERDGHLESDALMALVTSLGLHGHTSGHPAQVPQAHCHREPRQRVDLHA